MHNNRASPHSAGRRAPSRRRRRRGSASHRGKGSGYPSARRPGTAAASRRASTITIMIATAAAAMSAVRAEQEPVGECRQSFFQVLGNCLDDQQLPADVGDRRREHDDRPAQRVDAELVRPADAGDLSLQQVVRARAAQPQKADRRAAQHQHTRMGKQSQEPVPVGESPWRSTDAWLMRQRTCKRRRQRTRGGRHDRGSAATLLVPHGQSGSRPFVRRQR